MTVPAEALPTPAAVARAGNDFPDWLSPMLVKELRQGVRTRVFVTMFILLQVAMLMTVSLTLLVAANGGGTSEGSAVFWVIVGVPTLLVLPLTALGAVNGEIRANTLELIFLSRLTAFRIVVGKWLAIFVQCLLFVTAVLPYLVLRYFIGGINVSDEMQILAWMLVGAAVLSAAATGLSAYPLWIALVMAVLLGIVGIIVVGNMSIFFIRGAGSSGRGWGAVEIIALLLCAGIVLVLMLEVAVMRIAPLAENHSATVRLLAVGVLVIDALTNFIVPGTAWLLAVTCLITGFVCLLAVNEEPRWLPRLFQPFNAWGWPGRMASWLLYPGWHTGVPFAVLAFGALAALMANQHVLGTTVPPWYGFWIVAVLGALLFPVALVRTFLPHVRRPLAPFVVIQIVCVLVAIVALICDNALGTSLGSFVSVLPLTALIVSANLHGTNDFLLALPCVTTVVSAGLLLVAMGRAWLQSGPARDESLRLVSGGLSPELTPPLPPDEPLV